MQKVSSVRYFLAMIVNAVSQQNFETIFAIDPRLFLAGNSFFCLNIFYVVSKTSLLD